MKPEKSNSHIQSLIDEIKILIIHSRQELGRTANRQLLNTYWQIGQVIVERENAQNLSARKLILDLSRELTKQLGKGFSRSNLFNMRLFYLKYPDVQTVSGHVSWSHVCELLSVEDNDARAFYEAEMMNSKWSVRELKRQINSSLFERLLLSKGPINKNDVIRLSKEGQIIEKPEDIIKEPYVLEFLGIPENKPILEKDLEKRLIRYIEDFLLELGKGFMFVGSQRRITIGNKHHYVDMVFYNKILRAYILIDLKMKKLLPSYVGQMNAYLNYYKTEINEDIDNDPIGIILCTAKDEIVAEYALGGLANPKLCPFNNKVPNCTKDKAKNPLGVCSILHNETSVITCPTRFREDWLIIENAAEFAFGSQATWTSLSEIKLVDKNGQSAGNIDFVLVQYDNDGNLIDFASLEVQGVYISGNLRNPFEAYMKKPSKEFSWPKGYNYPKPDYLSSSRKRLIPQMLYKGGIFQSWKKKQTIAIQKSFFETLPSLPTTTKSKADIAWFLYDLDFHKESNSNVLSLTETIYTEFESALQRVTTPEPGSIGEFINNLQNRLDEHLDKNSPDAPSLSDIISS